VQTRRQQIRNSLQCRGKEISPDQAIEARQQICELDRLINYTTLALSNLPAERIARARAIRFVIDTILKLGAD
jgi:hypothetical protein